MSVNPYNVLLLLALAVGIAALVVGSLAYSHAKTTTAAHLQATNPSSDVTILYYSYGTVLNPRVDPGSTDTSGSVLGLLNDTGIFEIIVHFSTPYSVAPNAVILTPATPNSGIPTTGYLLTVDNITTTGFEMIGYSPTSLPDGVLFYYMVI